MSLSRKRPIDTLPSTPNSPNNNINHVNKRARLGSLTNKLSHFNIEGQCLQQLQAQQQMQQQIQQIPHQNQHPHPHTHPAHPHIDKYFKDNLDNNNNNNNNNYNICDSMDTDYHGVFEGMNILALMEGAKRDNSFQEAVNNILQKRFEINAHIDSNKSSCE